MYSDDVLGFFNCAVLHLSKFAKLKKSVTLRLFTSDTITYDALWISDVVVYLYKNNVYNIKGLQCLHISKQTNKKESSLIETSWLTTSF